MPGPAPLPTPSPPSPGGLFREVESLPAVGATRAKAFRNLGVSTLGDLLDYFPRDYQFESSELPISRLVDNQIQTTRGEVVAVDYIGARPRPGLKRRWMMASISLPWFGSTQAGFAAKSRRA